MSEEGSGINVSGLAKAGIEDVKQSIYSSLDQLKVVLRLMREHKLVPVFFMGAILSIGLSSYWTSRAMKNILSAQDPSISMSFLYPLGLGLAFFYSLFLIYSAMNAAVSRKVMSEIDEEKNSVRGIGILWRKKKSILIHSLLRPLIWVAPGKLFIFQSLLGLSETSTKEKDADEIISNSILNNPLRKVLFFFFPALADEEQDDIKSVVQSSDKTYEERFGSSNYGFVNADVILLAAIFISVLMMPVMTDIFQSWMPAVLLLMAVLFFRLTVVATVRTAYYIPEDHLDKRWINLIKENRIK